MLSVKVSDDYQIIVPSEVREHLGISPGDSLQLILHDDNVVLTLDPRSHARRLLGLHKEVWEGIDTDEYLRQERASWKDTGKE